MKEKLKRSIFYVVGKNYFIRTVTMHHIGRLVEIDGTEMVFEDACWVADNGRFHQFLRDGVLDEIEPFVDPIMVNRQSIIDGTLWRHPLPKDQK